MKTKFKDFLLYSLALIGAFSILMSVSDKNFKESKTDCGDLAAPLYDITSALYSIDNKLSNIENVLRNMD